MAYTAMSDALRDFVQQCRGQDKKTETVWRDAVQRSLGKFGQVLINIVPEFEDLMPYLPMLLEFA